MSGKSCTRFYSAVSGSGSKAEIFEPWVYSNKLLMSIRSKMNQQIMVFFLGALCQWGKALVTAKMADVVRVLV